VARGQPGARPAVGRFLGQRPSQEYGTRLAVGRQHRPQERRWDLDALANRVKEVQDQVVVAFRPIQRQPGGGVEASNGSGHANGQVVCERVGGPGTTRRGNAGGLKKNLERISPGLGPKAVVHAEKDYRPVVINHTRAPFG
jgi:hypothetical protein